MVGEKVIPITGAHTLCGIGDIDHRYKVATIIPYFGLVASRSDADNITPDCWDTALSVEIDGRILSARELAARENISLDCCDHMASYIVV